MDSALRSSEADPERIGHLSVREPGDVPKHDGFSVLVGELPERGDNPLPQVSTQRSRLREVVGPLLRGEVLDRGGVDGQRSPATRARHRRIDSDSVEPGEERRVAPIAVEVAPGLDERILHDLLDVPGVVEDTEEDGAQPMLMSANDLRKGIEVARTRKPSKFDVRPRVGGHLRDRTIENRFQRERHLTNVLNLFLKPWVATCHETSERLSDYVDGELEGRSLLRVRRHLARCEMCRALLDSLSRTIDDLRSLGAGEPAVPHPATVAVVLSRIEREQS